MNVFQEALDNAPGLSKSQDAVLLRRHFPRAALEKWAAYKPTFALGVKSASWTPHADYEMLMTLARALNSGDRRKAASILRVLGDAVIGGLNGGEHIRTGFTWGHKQAAAVPASATPKATPATLSSDAPDTGPEAIAAALGAHTADSLISEGHTLWKSGNKSKRTRATAMMELGTGLKRNGLTPRDLLVKSVPVIPAHFRPTTMMGDQLTLGDANELYMDLMHTRDAYKELHTHLGDEGTGDDKLRLLDCVKSVYGYGEPTNPKLKGRGVEGFLSKITGKSGPKTGFVQRKLLSKPVDFVGRAVIVPDPDLGMDEISIPEEMAWDLYGPHVQRRLVVHHGLRPLDALQQVKDKSDMARHALKIESTPEHGRPVVYSRAPAWHKQNLLSAWPKIHDGDHIAISTFVTAGLAADFDGDQINVHVPVTHEAIQDCKERLMASKMSHSVRDFKTLLTVPKHEQILGLRGLDSKPPEKTHVFKSVEEAVKAIKAGQVRVSDMVAIQP